MLLVAYRCGLSDFGQVIACGRGLECPGLLGDLDDVYRRGVFGCYLSCFVGVVFELDVRSGGLLVTTGGGCSSGDGVVVAGGVSGGGRDNGSWGRGLTEVVRIS